MIVPVLTNYIIKLEAWDYKSTEINHQIWRNFLVCEFNVVIFFLTQIDMIVDVDLIPNSKEVVEYQESLYPCPEV